MADALIKFNCKNCNQKFSIAETHAGKKVQCPKCQTAIVIPKPQTPPPDTNQNNINNAKPSSNHADFEFTFLEIPQINETKTKAPSQDETLDELEKLEAKFGKEKPPPPPKRKLPWLIDIFIYPASTSGLIILGIVIGIPFFINLFAGLVGPFGLFIVVPGWIINIMAKLYGYWYFCECIRDSATGGLRAPDTTAITPSLGEILLQTFRSIGCFAFFAAPMIIYIAHTKKADAIFYSLMAYAIFFFPMALLAIIMFDSFDGLNPILLIGSIISTLLPYCALALLCFAIGRSIVWTRTALSEMPLLLYTFQLTNVYMLFIVGHLIGRFGWRYKEKLNWECL